MTKSKRHQINGILLVNKPKGLTSNTCLQKIKWIYQATKAGHTGSLDPLATGMLPICFGEATKFSQYLLDSDKCYEARGRLGIKTNTGDALGEKIEEVSDFKITEEDLLKTISNFVGNIQQIPSSFSALKYRGKPLYHYARQGIAVPVKSRQIMIQSIELKAFDGVHFDIGVHCSKGTYIRNLVEDIGDSLKVGAHVTALHRTSVAGFERQPMYSLEDLDRKSFQALETCLLPLDSMLSNFPAIHLDSDDVIAICCGQPISFEKSLTSSLILSPQIEDHFNSLPSRDLIKKSLTQSKEISDSAEDNCSFGSIDFTPWNNNLEKLELSSNKLIRLYQRKTAEFIGLGTIESNAIKAKRLISITNKI